METKSITIRKLKFMEIPSVIKFAKTSFNEEGFGYHFAMKSSFIFTLAYIFNKVRIFIALDNNKIIGYAFIAHFRKNNLGILVKKEYCGKGIGGRLMKNLLEGQKDVWLSVEEENTKALNLYLKMGFKCHTKVWRMKKP